MYPDNDKMNRKDLESQIEKILNDSQVYLNNLLLIKNQLYDIHCLNQSDLYIEKINEIDKIVHNLTENLHNIEQIYSQLNESERSKIDLFRIEIEREMSDLYKLREQISMDESCFSIIEENTEIENSEENQTTNELRQRHITTNRLNNSYDLLEQDLVYLREKVDEVSRLIALQEQQLTRIYYLRHIAQKRIYNATSVISKTIHNQYVTLASGALLGATVGGPVGFLMGTKIGALVALSGSALGALSVNIMQQKKTETDESQDNSVAYPQAML